ncbi:MAG TPA: hypothetical protein VHZ97_21860 [Pseudonocardiaceae bacterium]|jgi:hypothetical protein|nr:hypothetical protein [Pseudonocardiaceae bacterium]
MSTGPPSSGSGSRSRAALVVLFWFVDRMLRQRGGLYLCANGIAVVRNYDRVEAHLRWEEIEGARWVRNMFVLVLNLVPIPF